MFVNVVGIDQDIADIVVEVITNGADHQAGFLIDQESAFARIARFFNGAPEFEQIAQIPLQLRGAAAYAVGARNDGHAVGIFQLVHVFFQLGAFIALDAAANTTTTRVVGHQDHIAASQADKGGERCAFVAALFFLNLHKQILAFADHILNARLAWGDCALKVLFRDFFKGQKTVAVFAVIDKTRFERRLNARDDGFIDIAFALLAPFDFGFVVKEFLPLNDGQAALFLLRRVNQHSFHDLLSLSPINSPMRARYCREGKSRLSGNAGRAGSTRLKTQNRHRHWQKKSGRTHAQR